MTHLCVQGFFLLPGLILMFLLSSPMIRPRAFPWDLETVVAIPLCWILGAILLRGGMSLPLSGLALVRSDGRRASPLACGWRSLLVWALPTACLAASRYLQQHEPNAVAWHWGLWVGAQAILLAFAGLALLLPGRSLNDRLSGTVLVPN